MREAGETQASISASLGIQQASLSRFLAGSNGLHGETVLKLWPFVYGDKYPQQSSYTEPPHAPQA